MTIDITLDGPERTALEIIYATPSRSMGRRALTKIKKVKPAVLHELAGPGRRLLTFETRRDAYALTEHGLAALGRTA